MGLKKPISKNLYNILNKIVFGVLSIALLMHFFIIALKLLPDNPINHQNKFQIRSYVDPFFSQNWNLFSPNPVNTNLTVLLQFKIYSNGRVDTTNWVDIMQPLVDAKREYFWTPAQRISKFVTTYMQQMNETKRLILEIISKDDTLSSDTKKAEEFFENALVQTIGHQAIIQYSHYVFNKLRLEKNYKNIDSIHVRYNTFNAVFPRFSKRKLDYFDPNNYEFSQSVSKYHPLRYYIKGLIVDNVLRICRFAGLIAELLPN